MSNQALLQPRELVRDYSSEESTGGLGRGGAPPQQGARSLGGANAASGEPNVCNLSLLRQLCVLPVQDSVDPGVHIHYYKGVPPDRSSHQMSWKETKSGSRLSVPAKGNRVPHKPL